MKRFAIYLMGQEVAAFEYGEPEEPITLTFDQEEGDAHDVTGGSFERDTDPIDPIADRYPEWEEKKRKFGF